MRFLTSLLSVTFALSAHAGDPALKLSKEIDRHLTRDWAIKGVHPAPIVDDLTFLRRASLDLIGRIPTLDEIQSFRSDNSNDKRAKLVDRLLSSKEFATHFASITRFEWLPQTTNGFRLIFAGSEFEGWLETQIHEKKPFDKIVTKILTAEATVGQRGMIGFGRPESGDRQALSVFYEAAEGKPEEMAAATSRLFLGVKLECAQCHDHPFAPYTREQFWEFAAFFGEFSSLSPIAPSFVGPLTPQYEVNRLTIPNTNRELTARFFTGTEPEWKPDRSPRAELAAWLTQPGNSLFARNWTNRLWAHFFGTGLIEPIAEPSDTNPPSHPAVLDALTEAAISSQYDLRVILKGIALSRAYQLSGTLTHPSQADPKQFAHVPAKGLTGHQIFDSLNTAAGKPPHLQKETSQSRRNSVNEVNGGSRGEFVARFPQSNRRTESATSILQSLMLMNGKYIAELVTAPKNPLLAELAKSKDPSNAIVEKLFLATLGRSPKASELDTFSLYLDTGGPTENYQRSLSDLFWILVNSSEFLLNH